MIKKIKYLVIAAMLFVTSTMIAQVTTSGINGKVSSNGETIIGATIVATHTPSGTTYGAVTNEKGRYSIQGMRVGGPYTIVISYVGYNKQEIKDVQLALGETSTFDAVLNESTQQLNEVVVSASVGVKTAAGGAASNFNQSQISSTPTIDRNIYDVAKLSPMVSSSKIGGISFIGSNNRYNSFQIDGMVSNDVFGLAGSGTNGGQTGANPISLDAIQEIQVVVSPFDVRQSGFTGGGINAITKSGTNQFKGTAYGYLTNQNMYGNWSQVKDTISKLSQDQTQTYGFTVGGPIIKDKVFFFANVENRYDTYPSDYYPGNVTSYITPAEAKAIADRYNQITGISDNYAKRNINKQGLSLLGRIDWNIDNNNKFSLRYQYNNSYQDVYGNSNTAYYFANSTYRIADKTNSLVAELNSHISNSWYNEARAGLTSVRDSRDVPYQGPNITIKNLGGGYDVTTGIANTTGKVTGNIGTEYSSGANILNQDIYTIEDNLSWYKGDHTLTFGTHNEIYSMYNLFIQASNGAYTFNNLNDFMNDKPSQFIYNYSDPTITGSTQWAATLKAGQFGVYAQDKWNVTNNLNVTYGVRFDMPSFFNTPSVNADFNASTYATANNVQVGQVPTPAILVSPRFGFRWYTDDSHKTLVRGGTGLFTGRVPFVWLSNCWSNTGVEMKGTTINSSVPSLATYWNNPQGAMNSAAGAASKPTINTVSKDFKYPQVFRSNLALEQELPGDVKMTLEGIFSKTLNNVWFNNLALQDNGKVYAVSADDANSATTFYKVAPGSYSAIINLQNTSKGYTYALSAQLEKKFNFGLDLMGSYTFGHAYSVNDGTSSVAFSNWKYNYAINPNDPNELSYSVFDVPNRFLATATYTTPKYANGRLATVVSLIYNGFNGMRYCLTMNETPDFNGDGQKGNSELYIPTTGELAKMTFVAPADATNFEKWIESDSYAKNHRGQYAPRYSNSAPWENHFDLHLAEDFYYLKNKSEKISLTFDIMNLGNMINHNWGAVYASDYNVQPLKVTKLTADANGNQIPTYSYQDDKVAKSDIASRWHGQIGLRVTF